MRAGDIFKFAHMAVFVTGLGVSLTAMTPAYAQVVEPEFPAGEDLPGEEEEEEGPPAEEEEEEEPPVEEEEEEEPPVEEEEEEEEEPPVEEEEEEPPVEEEEEEPPVEEEGEYEEEPRARETEREGDNPNDNRFAKTNKNPNRLIVKSDREAYLIPFTRRASPPATKAIGDAITNSYAFCGNIKDERYLVDCLAERLQSIARSLPRTGDYDEARAILLEASKEMRALVVANKSPTAPRVRATGVLGAATVRTRPLNAVRKDQVKQVNRAAAAILEEAETKLLRAAQASDRRLIAYAQIAKAVGSNKKLLRSA